MTIKEKLEAAKAKVRGDEEQEKQVPSALRTGASQDSQAGLPKNQFTDFDSRLPPAPIYEEGRKSTSDSVQRIIDLYENNGWWSNIFESSKVEFAERQAKKAVHLLALQQTANQTEAVAYLRAHNLWTLEIEAVLKGEEAKSKLLQQHQLRTSVLTSMVLDRNALEVGLTTQAHQEVLINRARTEDELTKEREQSRLRLNERELQQSVDFEDFEQREILKQTLEVRTYRQKSEALTQHALFEDTIRAQRVSGLERLYIEFHELVKLVVFPEDEPLKQRRLVSKQKEIERLEGILHGVGRDSKGPRAEDSGEDDGGGAPPTESGFPPKAQSKHSKQPPSSSNLGHVN